MKILNLVYPHNSQIGYQIQRFPDGQQNIVISNVEQLKPKTVSTGILGVTRQLPLPSIQIKSRLNNWKDLELIVCVVASLRELGVEEIHLYVPYIVGGRSDRKFQEGGNNYIKDVIAPVINSLNFKTVTCIDPHSDVLEACIKGFRKESNINLVQFFLANTYNTPKQALRFEPNGDYPFILISPDAGASKKIYKLAEQIGYKGDIITCSKDRDVDGELTEINVPLPVNRKDWLDYRKKDFIIIDDICDGGKTFINIAKELKVYLSPEANVYLIVTHGIFSKGFKELSKYFDGVYCTNSYKDVGDFAGNDLQKTNVKQLNVF